MKILCISRSCIGHNKNAGMERISHQILSGLVKRGFIVDFVTTSLYNEQTEIIKTENDGIEYIYLPCNIPKTYSANFNEQVLSYMKYNHDYDLIYSVSAGANILKHNNFGIKVVVTWHAPLIHDDIMRVIDYAHRNNGILNPYNIEDIMIGLLRKIPRIKKNIEDFDYNIAINDYVKENLILYGIDEKKVKTIYNGVKDYFKYARSFPKDEAKKSFGLSDKVTLGVVGRNHRLKGHDLLKTIIEGYDPSKYQLFLVGFDKKDSVFSDIKLDVVSTTLAHEDMPRAYRAMDILCNTGYMKTLDDTTVKEALVSGTKAVAPLGATYISQYDRFNATYGDRTPLLTFRTGDLGSLKAALNRAERRRLPDNYDMIDEFYSEDAMVESYASVFKSLT